MESYPTEFTFHTSPLLFVAGLNPPSSNGTPQDAAPTDPFEILTASLRKTFASRKGFQLWDNSRGQNQDFHTLLVDKSIRFPPLKARPTSSSAPSSTAPTLQPPAALHSPISPLTPTSPLYPDGIIAPIWIRKHRELIPSVFILVLRLFESPSSGGGPVNLEEREEEERQHDAQLIREIIDRKRSTLERGIKLAVVLLCSRELLDDPSLDLRLSLIRRQSGLDSRASLFVISPVPQSEVNNFVASIRSELWPAAIDYYREHARRVRRKRARQPAKGGLSERGWNVRYDYKLALFAEMRGESEVALKHYEDCYESLVDMFSQPNLLMARTKRWAEAKVLADCLTVKIAKLYLYLNDPSHSLSQLNRHVFRFRQLSESWSIGEETFEFWSWLSKQYRLFGDLTTAALRAGFRLPSLRPPPTPIPTPGVPQPPSPGLMPLNVLQHPGHYYFLSAVCALERRERYRTIKSNLETNGNGLGDKPPEGALLHEGKVDHTEIIIELYTKAYEHFKHHGRRRTTYFLASLIASAHASSPTPNVEMALKFWDRIGRNYRKDGWNETLEGIEEAVFECAKEGGRWVEAIKAGWNLIAPDSSVSEDRRAQFAEELKSILTSRSPTTPEQASLHFASDASPILIPRLTFYKPTTTISSQIPYQLAISAPSSARLSAFTFDNLHIHFNDDRPPLIVQHSSEVASTKKKVERYELKGDESFANLRWENGTTKVFFGSVSSDVAISLTVEKVVLNLSIGDWKLSVDLQLDDKGISLWYLDDERTIPLQTETTVCSIMPRVLELEVDVKQSAPAYLGERYPIELDITNRDDIEVEVSLVGFLQPGAEGSHSRLSIDEHSSSSLLDSIPLGVLAPRQSLRKTLFVECLAVAGDRHLDLTIRSSPSPSIPDHAAKPTSTESNHSLAVPCVSPFERNFQAYVYPRRSRQKSVEKEESGWEGAGDASVSGQIKARGPWSVEVIELRVREEETPDARVTVSSLDELTSELPIRLEPNDALGAVFSLKVKPLLATTQGPPRMPSLAVTWRRCETTEPPTTTTILPFPPVRQLPLLPRVTLQLPPSMTANSPIPLEYVISNPTPRILHLASQIDPPGQPNSLAFAGPRHATSIVLAPGEERTIQVRIVPLLLGKLPIPRFRVYEVEQIATPVFDEDGRPVPPRMRELEVETEIMKAPPALVDVGENSVGEGETDGLARVVVLSSRSYPPEQ